MARHGENRVEEQYSVTNSANLSSCMVYKRAHLLGLSKSLHSLLDDEVNIPS